MLDRSARRLAAAVIAGAATGAALLGLSPMAYANEDPAADPPGCSTADLEGVRAGVDASTSAYLFTHPDLNGFVSHAQGPVARAGRRQGQGLSGRPSAGAGRHGRHPAAAGRS